MIIEIFSYINEWRIASPIIFSIVGIVINYIIIVIVMNKSPEGGMGMGILLIIGFIPFAMPVLGCISGVMWLADKVFKLLGFRGFI